MDLEVGQPVFRGTTILAVRRDNSVALGGDGQVTVGETVMKERARKIRRLREGTVLAGFAGAVADGLTLFERLESRLDEYRGNLPRAVVEMAKDWRSDRILRRLEALLAVVDRSHSLLVSGSGEVIEPDDGILGIGSGGPYAVASARSLLRFSSLSAAEIVSESLQIAASLCIYTNREITVEEL